MPKFSSERFPPGFFDLPRDAGETLPADIIERWTTAPQTPDTARAILAPHRLHGAVVVSDSAGLTRLSRERALVEILAMISRPKELVHAWGTAAGGRALGVWAADNTEMFYPDQIAADRVIGAMLSAMDQIGKECEVRIGLCAHHGDFFVLGGGVYGPDADRVEIVAEDHTEGGELVITDSLAARLNGAHGFVLRPRADLERTFGAILRVDAGPRVTDAQPSDFDYPAPFTSVFFEEIADFNRTGRPSRMPKPAYHESAVVLIEREREDTDVPEVAVLNDLALSAAMKRIGASLLEGLGGTEIKTIGLISIFVFKDCASGVTFAEGFRAALRALGIACRIGVDTGQVLVFDLGAGARDIAGTPVNVASKLAQDLGEFGTIYVSEAAARKAGRAAESLREFKTAGVTIRAVAI